MDKDIFVEYGDKAAKSLTTNDTQGLFEAIGVLKFRGYTEYAILLTSKYYFLQKNFHRCLQTLEEIKGCQNEKIKDQIEIWYWNYKIASLAQLNRFEEIRAIFLEGEGLFDADDDIVMDLSAFSYVKFLSQKAGFEKDGVGIFRPDVLNDAPNKNDDGFWSIIYRELGKDILQVYLHSIELVRLESAKIEKSIQKSLKADAIENVKLLREYCNQKYFEISNEMDCFFDVAQKRIANNMQVEKEEVIKIISLLFNEDTITKDIFCWEFTVELFSALMQPEDFVYFFQRYSKYIVECLTLKKETIARQILTVISNKRIALIKCGETTFEEYWKEKIEEYIPGYIENNSIISCNQEIYDQISNESKWAYESAVWQYEQVLKNGSELMDAGLLSLAFMRVLEKEINSRFVLPVSKLIQKERERKDMLEASEDYKALTNSSFKGYTLGELNHFFRRIKEQKSDGAKLIYSLMVEKILSPSGIKALEERKFEEITNQKITDKFRNPPAHSRFLQKKEAVHAKEYTEDKLKMIFDF